MNKRTKNVNIFKDSVDLMQESSKLQQAIKESVKNQRLYLETAEVAVPESKGFSCKTVVSTKRSFEAASAYARAGKKVAVLNFASSTNPGGGVTRGSSAQEECLCRCSTLYPCLDTDMMWNQFYKPHRNAGNPLYNDDCLYTPGVIVFKSDISFPERMDEESWYQVDVITCAAPNLRNVPSNMMNPFAGNAPADIEDDVLYKLHIQRLERVFRVAAANGAQVLILGAFGCGAFCNPPAVVAKAFKAVQEKYASYFEMIEYAVFCSGHETQNYDAFCEVFGAEKKYDLSRFIEVHEKDMAETVRMLTNCLCTTPRIETSRLLLREIQETDVKDIFDCWMQDEDVSRYMCWKASCDIAETRNFVRFEVGQIQNEKWYRWIIELKETGRIIGTCLVFYNEEDDESHWDISYNLGKKYWGNGYITEAMKAVMRFAETALGMEECVTAYAKVNTSSANVLHKLGFTDEAVIPYECSGGDMITEGILCRYKRI